jgi:hypothetical protein
MARSSRNRRRRSQAVLFDLDGVLTSTTALHSARPGSPSCSSSRSVLDPDTSPDERAEVTL